MSSGTQSEFKMLQLASKKQNKKKTALTEPTGVHCAPLSPMKSSLKRDRNRNRKTVGVYSLYRWRSQSAGERDLEADKDGQEKDTLNGCADPWNTKHKLRKGSSAFTACGV